MLTPETTAVEPAAPPQKYIRAFRQLSYADVALILALHDDGKAQTFIAQQLGCDQSTISRILKDFQPTADLAKKRAHRLALPAVESLERAMKAAEKQGKSGPQEAILKISGVLGDESKGPQVLVQIGVKDSEVQVNVIPIYQTQTDSASQQTQVLPAPQLSASEAKG